MKLVYLIKKNLKEGDKERKIQLLILVPDDWSINRTMEFFNIIEYSIKQARNLTRRKEFCLPPRKYSREGIDGQLNY